EASSRLTRAEAALAKASEAANERARMDLAATQKKEVIVMNKEAEVTQQIKDLQLATATLGRDLKSVEKRVAEAMDALEHREMESAAETAQAQRELADVRKRGELLIIKNRQLEQAATVVEEKPPVRLTETDEREHVIAIEGIGTKFAARLNAAGVISIPQLVKADADQIATRIDATTELVKEWQAMGRLIQVRGVGPQYAEVLVKAGVRSVEQLAAADALDVARRVQKLEEERKVRLQGGKVSEGTVNRWIQAARARDFA
ncbi:MAG TPA: DUF4332 domain-containing protein, partial [Candidatus Thermoplasmatota archaeon]|nr:DUF4332 domain-containing protein [Candidatus Thermoplasmatota archaeon]